MASRFRKPSLVLSSFSRVDFQFFPTTFPLGRSFAQHERFLPPILTRQRRSDFAHECVPLDFEQFPPCLQIRNPQSAENVIQLIHMRSDYSATGLEIRSNGRHRFTLCAVRALNRARNRQAGGGTA